MRGTIVFWRPQNGFGFVKSDAGGPDAMVHISEVNADVDELSVGQRVSYDVGIDQRSGKPRAKNVEVIEWPVQQS